MHVIYIIKMMMMICDVTPCSFIHIIEDSNLGSTVRTSNAYIITVIRIITTDEIDRSPKL